MKYAYWLANIPGVGVRSIGKLLAYAGTPQEVFNLTQKQLERVEGIGNREVEAVVQSRREDWQAHYEGLAAQGIRFVPQGDSLYPGKLKNIVDAPYALYVKGHLPEPEQRCVAVVGARMCSPYGQAAAKDITRTLASRGATVISGMAKGIDSAGHVGALDGGGTTFAVLGCGIDVCYPESNRALYERIQEHGGILSEYPPGMPPASGLFPARNRIIAALCDVLVVVEAKLRSGSLITADFALEQGKDVYVVPGRIYDALSGGCNALIEQGAGVITNARAFADHLGLEEKDEGADEKKQNLSLEKDEALVYSCVDLRPKGIEELSEQTKLVPAVLAGILFALAEKGLVTETFQNYFVRKI